MSGNNKLRHKGLQYVSVPDVCTINKVSTFLGNTQRIWMNTGSGTISNSGYCSFVQKTTSGVDWLQCLQGGTFKFDIFLSIDNHGTVYNPTAPTANGRYTLDLGYKAGGTGSTVIYSNGQSIGIYWMPPSANQYNGATCSNSFVVDLASNDIVDVVLNSTFSDVWFADVSPTFGYKCNVVITRMQNGSW